MKPGLQEPVPVPSEEENSHYGSLANVAPRFGPDFGVPSADWRRRNVVPNELLTRPASSLFVFTVTPGNSGATGWFRQVAEKVGKK